MARRRRSANPDARRAQQQAAVEYAPQRASIRQALADLASQRDSDIQGARSAARGIVQATREARPQVRSGFQSVLREAGQDNSAMNSDLGGLSGAGLIRSFARSEQRGAGRRINESLASLLGELGTRESGARAGAAYAETKARNDYAAGRVKASRQLQALSREQGARAQSVLSDIQAERAKMEFEAQQKAADRAATLRAAGLRAAGRGRGTGRSTGGRGAGPRGAAGLKPLTAEQSRKVLGNISAARGWASKFLEKGVGVDQIKTTLATGAKSGQASIPSFSNDVIDAALDLELYGGVTKNVARSLTSSGVRLTGYRVVPNRPRAGSIPGPVRGLLTAR